MNYTIIEKNNKTYLNVASSETPIAKRQDGLDLIGACMENDTALIMLHADALGEDFYRLRTGVAGEILQKFINYRIKAALVIPHVERIKGKFQEVMAESNQGNDFRVFESAEEAEAWLVDLS